jgi:hypothetical protein
MELFKQGDVLFRTHEFYRTHDDLGRAVQFKSCIGFYARDRGHLFPKLEDENNVLNLKDAKSLLIYPVTEPHDAWMQSWSAVGPYNFFEDILSKLL